MHGLRKHWTPTAMTIEIWLKTQLKSLRKQYKKAFSIVELMIVVTIIGILSAIAIPAYNDYVVRSKIAEVIHYVEPFKAGIIEYYNAHGTCPPGDSLYYINILSEVDLTKYVAWITNYNMNGSSCGIHVGFTKNVFHYEGTHADAPRLAFNYYFNDTKGVGEWKCETTWGLAIPAKYLPSFCH